MIEYKIFPEKALIVICHIGDVSFDETMALRERVRKDPDLVHVKNAINDMSDCTSVLTYEQLEKLASGGDQADHRRLANIAPNSLSFAVSRQYVELSNSREVNLDANVFRTATEALAWLEIPDFGLDEVLSEFKETIKATDPHQSNCDVPK